MMAELDGLVIRPALAEDAEGAARVYLESAVHHERIDRERYFIPDHDAVLARFEERRCRKDSVTLIATLAGEVVGFLDVELTRSTDLMHRGFRYCHMVELAVLARERSRGIGMRLLQAAEQWGREQGARYASLEYLAGNTRVAKLYEERMGYRKAAVMMVKPLEKE